MFVHVNSFSELHFLVEWEAYDSHSIIGAKQVTNKSPSGLGHGDIVSVKEKGKIYQATIVGVGKFNALFWLQLMYHMDP